MRTDSIEQVGLLTTLEIDNNPLGDMGGVALAGLLQHPEKNSLTTLRAANCRIGDDGTYH
jgi:hypothetical protein